MGEAGHLGRYFDSISVPEVECVSSGVAVGKSGKAIAAGLEDRADLIAGSEKPLCLAR